MYRGESCSKCKFVTLSIPSMQSCYIHCIHKLVGNDPKPKLVSSNRPQHWLRVLTMNLVHAIDAYFNYVSPQLNGWYIANTAKTAINQSINLVEFFVNTCKSRPVISQSLYPGKKSHREETGRHTQTLPTVKIFQLKHPRLIPWSTPRLGCTKISAT